MINISLSERYDSSIPVNNVLNSAYSVGFETRLAEADVRSRLNNRGSETALVELIVISEVKVS